MLGVVGHEDAAQKLHLGEDLNQTSGGGVDVLGGHVPVVDAVVDLSDVQVGACANLHHHQHCNEGTQEVVRFVDQGVALGRRHVL